MKFNILRAIALIGLLLLALLVASEFQAIFWTKEYALKRALSNITEICISNGRDPKLLSELHQTTVGGTQWAFESMYQGKPRYLYGIWFSKSGAAEFYGGDPDDPGAAAYDHKNTPNAAEQGAAANP